MTNKTIMYSIVILVTIIIGCYAYTYEPPGRDPASIEKIRDADISTSLTTDNFDELTKDKLVFIKFYSPGCPHCKELIPAWNELTTYYNEGDNNDNILIGSVDCTDSPKGKGLCAKFKIMGLPTLYYGDASLGGIYLEEYGGDKSFNDLKAVKLEGKCNPGNLDACSASDRKEMKQLMKLPNETIDKKIKELEKQEEELRTGYTDKFNQLQKDYDTLVVNNDLDKLIAKNTIKLIKDIIDRRKKGLDLLLPQ